MTNSLGSPAWQRAAHSPHPPPMHVAFSQGVLDSLVNTANELNRAQADLEYRKMLKRQAQGHNGLITPTFHTQLP
eukprot:gene5576-4210_t